MFSKLLLTAVFDAFCLFVPALSLGKFSHKKLWYYLFFSVLHTAVNSHFHERRKQKPFLLYRLLKKFNFFIGFCFCLCVLTFKEKGIYVDIWFGIDVIRWISENESFFVLFLTFHLFVRQRTKSSCCYLTK